MTYRVLQLLCVLASLACAALQSVAQVRNLQVEAAPVNVPLVFLKPPPPNISDLVLLLQSYLPDQERVHKLREEMDTPVPGTEDGATLAIAWHKKATAAMELQDLEKASGFLEKALGYARDAKISNQNQLGGYRRVRFDYAATLWAAKGLSAAVDSFLEFVAEIEKAGGATGSPRM